MLPATRYFTVIAFVVAFLFNQSNTKEEQFKKTVKDIVDGFSRQDSLKISKYINKNTGIYLLHRSGSFDNYQDFKTVTFSNSTYPEVLFTSSKGIKDLSLKYSKLPTYDCEKTWSKKGLFVDTTKTDHLLSKICKDRNKYVPDTIPPKTIQSFFNLENKSRRIVLYDGNEKELVFYLSYLNGNWYLTIIDTVTSDCSV